MSTRQTEGLDSESAEVERLRARIGELEDELVSVQAWANEVVARAQARTYWLDRLHLDLDPIMRHVPFEFGLGVYRALRDAYRGTRKVAGAVVQAGRRRQP
jgi:hypothetical protein